MNFWKNEHEVGQKVLCFNCANIIEKQKSEKWFCIACKSEINKEKYLRLHALTTDIVHFGYTYRKQYEKDLADGSLGTHYCLFNLHEAISWLALAALSGIVGNASFELTKTVINKIKAQISKGLSDSDKEERLIISSEKEFSIFIQYLDDYRNGLANTDPAVRKAIMNEIEVDEAMKHEAFTKIKDMNDLNLVLAEAKENSISKISSPISEEDFAGMWKYIDHS